MSFSADPASILPGKQAPRGQGHWSRLFTKNPARKHGGRWGELTDPQTRRVCLLVDPAIIMSLEGQPVSGQPWEKPIVHEQAWRTQSSRKTEAPLWVVGDKPGN